MSRYATDRRLVGIIGQYVDDMFSEYFRELPGIKIFNTHMCVKNVLLLPLYYYPWKYMEFFEDKKYSFNQLQKDDVKKRILKTFKYIIEEKVSRGFDGPASTLSFEFEKAYYYYIYDCELDNTYVDILAGTMQTGRTTIHHSNDVSSSNQSVYPIKLSYPRDTQRKKYSENVPEKFICIVCREPFLNPVLSSVGNVYCEECIGPWLENHNTDPLTGMSVTKNLIPALSVWTEMNNWIAEK
jgi:hypothetical protein